MSEKDEGFAVELYNSYSKLLKCYEDSVEGLSKKNRVLLAESVKHKTQLAQCKQAVHSISTKLEEERDQIEALKAQIKTLEETR